MATETVGCGESSLRFTVNEKLTIEHLGEIAASAVDAVVRSPHAGAQHGNQVAVLLPPFRDVGIHVLDMNTVEKDGDFQPGLVVVPTPVGKPNKFKALIDGSEADQYVAHLRTNKPLEVKDMVAAHSAPYLDINDLCFEAGTNLADLHVTTMKAIAENPDRIRTLTEIYRQHPEIYAAVAAALSTPELADLLKFKVDREGKYSEIADKDKPTAVREHGMHRLADNSSEDEGVVMPLEGMLALDGLIRGRVSGCDKIYHIAGQDMIVYAQDKETQKLVGRIYEVAYSLLDPAVRKEIPPHMEIVLLPGSGLRFFGDSSVEEVLTVVPKAYEEFVSNRGNLLAAQKRHQKAVADAMRARDPSRTLKETVHMVPYGPVGEVFMIAGRSDAYMRALVMAYPEPYLPADARNGITQWHVLSGEVGRLSIPSPYLSMSLGKLARMQADLRALYQEVSR